MAWTYVLPLAIDRDRVRLRIGDTNTDDQQLQDEEINQMVEDEGNVLSAAAACCELLAAKYARKADKKMGDLSIRYEKISQHYQDLADRYWAQGQGAYAIPTAGGVEVSEKQAHQADDSVTHSHIQRGMHDFVAPPVEPNEQ